MRPIHFTAHPREQQLSATSLSGAAESGDIGRCHGILPERSHQPPADLLQSGGWRRFVDSSQPARPSAATPRPSDRRPAPRLPAA